MVVPLTINVVSDVVKSELLRPLSELIAVMSMAAVGAERSSLKLVVDAGLMFPARSVATAETVMVPSPSVIRSSALRTTA